MLQKHSPLIASTGTFALRPFEEGDFEDVAQLMGNPDVTRYLFWGPRTRKQSRDALDKRVAGHVIAPGVDYLALVIADCETGTFAGEVSLVHMANEHRNGELGYLLIPALQGRGIATQAAAAMRDIAFRELGLHRLQASCDDRNTASWRVMEKIGMRREAHFIRNAMVKGEWTGDIVCAILEDEWRGLAD